VTGSRKAAEASAVDSLDTEVDVGYAEEETAAAIDLEPFRSDKFQSGYMGVRLDTVRKCGGYRSHIHINGLETYLGSFVTAEEAARAYARLYLKKNGSPPAPNKAEQFRQDEANREDKIEMEPFRSKTSKSGWVGVNWDRSKQKYRAQLTHLPGEAATSRTHRRPRANVGTFSTVEEAAMAYARAFHNEYGAPESPALNKTEWEFIRGLKVQDKNDPRYDLSLKKLQVMAGVKSNMSKKKLIAKIDREASASKPQPVENVKPKKRGLSKMEAADTTDNDSEGADSHGEGEIDLEPLRSTNTSGTEAKGRSCNVRRKPKIPKLAGTQTCIG